MALPPTDREDLGSDDELQNDKELVLTDYDRIRKKVPVIRGRSIIMNTKILSTELTCPICLDILTNTMTTKECLHRFCSDCISMALLRGNKECPTCRTKLVSKRSLRHDTNFDELIKRIIPDRQKYESMLHEANKDGDDAISSQVAWADYGEEQRVENPVDTYDPFDKDAPTPPALLDSRRTTSPMEMDDEGGRKTPPWLKAGDLDPKLMGPYEKKLYMQAQKAYLILKSSRLGANIAELDRIFDGEATETYSKTSRDTSSPLPNGKQRKLSNGAPKKAQEGTPADEAKSGDSSDDSIDSDESETEGVRMEADLDHDHMEELAMLDPRTFLVQTSKEVPKKERPTGSKETPFQPGTSVITAFDGQSSSSAMPFIPINDNADDDLLFDPRENADPPYPDVVEKFEELMPNGKGGTWQQAIDNPEQPQDDDLDEELVFDEDDVLSVVSIDDLLHEMGMVSHEGEVETLYAEKKPEGVFSDLSKDGNEEKDKYMCDETRMLIREINELRAGGLGDIKATLEDTEQFDLGEATTWYSQRKNGEEMVYYEKSKQPLTRGRRRTTAVYDVGEEVERLGRRVTLKDIKDDMSNTDTDQGTPCTLSLASSPESSKLSLSDIVEEESTSSTKEEAPSVDLPPLNPGQVKERLHRWIGDVTPNTPEQIDTPLDRSTLDEEDEDDCESLPENYEIEAELRPSAALLSRSADSSALPPPSSSD